MEIKRINARHSTKKQHTNEYLADESGQVFEFKNTTSARDFLRDNGIKKPERQGIELIPKPALEEIKAYEQNPSWQL